jgi:outer membrane lipoprotein carrier protein
MNFHRDDRTMTLRRHILALLPALLLAGVPARAAEPDGVALLQQWIASTHSGRADFTQTVVDAHGKAAAPASGVFEFDRPGRFRWSYVKPYQQDIVSDGTSIWSFDHDLDQVTVGASSRALAGTPAALLAGADVSSLFNLAPLPAAGGLAWVQATPRQPDASFSWVRIGLQRDGAAVQLVQMQLHDAFGRTSTIAFAAPLLNPKFAPGHFHFEAPPGAAVMQQP